MGTVKPLRDATKTRAGAAVGGGQEAAILTEAEAGFDPTSLERRHSGRPSLSGRAGHSNRVDLRVDDQTYQAIRRRADEDQTNVSQVVREAIRHYIEAS